jgi:thioester reductase-like protein
MRGRNGRCEVLQGDFEHLPESIASEVEVIVHGAASTAFRAPIEDLRRTNVEGTSRMLEFAKTCPGCAASFI